MWLNTVQHDLRAYSLSLNEAVDLAQSRFLWEADVYIWHYPVRTASGSCQKRTEEVITH